MSYEHKCEQVLDPSYVPDPTDGDAVHLFKSQQRFMYSVFTKVLTEGKAVDILRNYSNPRSTTFGDAQLIYSDLCDHFDGGAQARVSAASLETELTNLRLNKNWGKSVKAFMNKVSHLIRDHKEATDGAHDDRYYIEKLKNTFLEHRDMSSHLRTLETQEAMLTRRMGATGLPQMTYEQWLFEISEYATTLDDRCSKNQSNRRNADSTNRQNANNSNSNNNGGGVCQPWTW